MWFERYRRFLLLIVLVSACFHEIAGDCALSNRTLEEDLDESSPIAVHLLFNCPRADVNVSCNVEVYDGENYIVKNEGFQSYTVREVFQQPEAAFLQPGMSIAVLHNTDTGFWTELPFALVSDPKGFLAFLTPYRDCFDDGNLLKEGEGLTENPFLLDECILTNKRWSDVSEEDVILLQSQEGYIAFKEVNTSIMEGNEASNSTANSTIEISDDPPTHQETPHSQSQSQEEPTTDENNLQENNTTSSSCSMKLQWVSLSMVLSFSSWV